MWGRGDHAWLSDDYPAYFGLANLNNLMDSAPLWLWRQLMAAKEINDRLDDDVRAAVGNAAVRLHVMVNRSKGT